MEADIKFDRNPLAWADDLDKKIRGKVLRIALNKGSSPVKKAAVAAAPRRYGYLAKSMRIRVRNYNNKSVWVSVIGPKNDFGKTKGVRTRGAHKGDPIYHRPAKYARLIEFGHGGKHAASARPFLAPALASTAGQFAETVEASIKSQMATILPQK